MDKILVIEDNHLIRENIIEILSFEHFNVLEAKDGETGVSIAKADIPDLILCDIMMPEMDGYAVFSQLKQFGSTCNIPFIFMSAKSTTEDICCGLDLGAEDYITKPIEEKKLISSIRCRIAKNKLFRNTLNDERVNYIKELQAMMTMVSHGVRNPMSSCLGLVNLLDPNNNVSISNEELKKIIDGIKASTLKLDDLTKDLSFELYKYILKHKEP